MTSTRTSKFYLYHRWTAAQCVSSRSGQRPPWTSGRIPDTTRQYAPLCHLPKNRGCTIPETSAGWSTTTDTRRLHTLRVHTAKYTNGTAGAGCVFITESCWIMTFLTGCLMLEFYCSLQFFCNDRVNSSGGSVCALIRTVLTVEELILRCLIFMLSCFV